LDTGREELSETDLAAKLSLALKREVDSKFGATQTEDGQWFHYLVVDYLGELRKSVKTPLELIQIDELISDFNRYPLLPLADRKKLCQQLVSLLKKYATESTSTNKPIENVVYDPKELWEEPVAKVKGVGSKMQASLQKLELDSVWDLLHYVPMRFVDRSKIRKIRELRAGVEATVMGTVAEVKLQKTFKGYRLLTVTLQDDTGKVDMVFFNQEFLAKKFRKGLRIIVTGKVESNHGVLQLTNLKSDSFEVIETGKDILPMVPIYRAGAGTTGNTLRKIIFNALDAYAHNVPEIFPFWQEKNFVAYPEAVENLHRPQSQNEFDRAREEIAYREIFVLQVLLALRKNMVTQAEGYSFKVDPSWLEELEKNLSFTLTNAQKRVISEILSDMQKDKPMNRLLQGDVGSGKTVVAMFAMFVAAKNGKQSAVMVPTEVLAFQHYMVFSQWAERFGLRVGLLVGSLPASEKEKIKRYLKSGQLDIVVGTHALIQEGTTFKDLGLVVIDEQHRFGVYQRAALIGMGNGKQPDVLVMSATPIPRTLVLTYYGDLDVSVIDELPPQRKPVKTFWVSQKRRSSVYEAVKKELDEGRQAYVVAPLIEESESIEAAAATKLYDELREGFLRGYKLGLLHGKMNKDDKKSVMDAFRKGELQVLVSTTVIEVGVDVPNATVMVIEGADRFGLSQLHQLRGRVVRSSYQPYCYLIADAKTEDAVERLDAMVKFTDGFTLAEKDLTLRGPGELMGEQQHGFFGMRVADLLKDMKMLQPAREDADRLVHNDPDLQSKECYFLRKYLIKEFGDAAFLLGVA
jgi:ATP-dependent DNA helicase RecG